MIYIDLLPDEILELIFIKLNNFQKTFLNKEYYKKYHYVIKSKIEGNLYENYLRDIIRLDSIFIFKEIIKERFEYWMIYNKSIKYQNLIFINYFSYINYLVNKYYSFKIKKEIIFYLNNNNSLDKWEQKPKILKRNKWRNI